MKYAACIFILWFSFQTQAQFVIKNYSNAPAHQLPTVEQIADWVQFHQISNVIPLLDNKAFIDEIYLNIESTYLSKEYSRDKILSKNHVSVSDNRDIIWYERNIYKKTKSKLKPRYQIYLTVEFKDGVYYILDLQLGKKKKINTSRYEEN